MALKQDGVHFFLCPKQGQGFKPSAAHLYPNISRVPPFPREAVFRRRRPKAHFMTGRTGSPVNTFNNAMLSGFELYPRWVPLSYVIIDCACPVLCGV